MNRTKLTIDWQGSESSEADSTWENGAHLIPQKVTEDTLRWWAKIAERVELKMRTKLKRTQFLQWRIRIGCGWRDEGESFDNPYSQRSVAVAFVRIVEYAHFGGEFNAAREVFVSLGRNNSTSYWSPSMKTEDDEIDYIVEKIVLKDLFKDLSKQISS